MIILQITTKSNNTNSFYESHHHNQQPIQLLPTFRIRMEWLHIFVVLLYTAGLVSTTTTYIHWVRTTTARYLISPIWESFIFLTVHYMYIVFHPFSCFNHTPISLFYMAFIGQRIVYPRAAGNVVERCIFKRWRK